MTPSAGSSVNRNALSPSEPDPARLGALVDAIPEPIAIVDAEWRFTYVNAAFERLSRVPEHALRGREVWQVFAQIVGSPLESHLRDAMRQGCITQIEFAA